MNQKGKLLARFDRIASKWLDCRIERTGFNTMLDNDRLPAQVAKSMRAGGVERLSLQDRVSELRGRIRRYERGLRPNRKA